MSWEMGNEERIPFRPIFSHLRINDSSLPVLRKNKGQILFEIAIPEKGNSP